MARTVEYLARNWILNIDEIRDRMNKAWDTIEWNRIQAPGTQGDFEHYWIQKLKWNEINKKLYPLNSFIELPEGIELWRADEFSPIHYYDKKLYKTIHKAPKDGNEARRELWGKWRELHLEHSCDGVGGIPS